MLPEFATLNFYYSSLGSEAAVLKEIVRITVQMSVGRGVYGSGLVPEL